MWDKIERFARRASMRADDVGGFLNRFKPMMGCGTLNPRFCKTGIVANNAIMEGDGSIIVNGEKSESRDFMISITEAPQEEQQKIVDCIYDQAQRIILLVRDRLEREKPIETEFLEEN